jgi:hypothetical protein
MKGWLLWLKATDDTSDPLAVSDLTAKLRRTQRTAHKDVTASIVHGAFDTATGAQVNFLYPALPDNFVDIPFVDAAARHNNDAAFRLLYKG